MSLSPVDGDALRVFVYDALIGSGTMPSIALVAAHLGATAENTRAALRGLRVGKTLLPHPDTGEIWMAGPFAAAPTSYRVSGRRVSWWANCAWDMLGIPAIVGESVEISASCTDCDLPMTVRVDPRTGPVPGTDGLVHFLVPARRWYDDIGFT
jgi:hypothetical protein